MSTRLQFDCDICGRDKRDVNHWYEFYAVHPGIGIRPFAGNDLLKQVCGHACAHMMLDRWLSTGSLEKPETAEHSALTSNNPVDNEMNEG